jgi:RimJ/RimL family protein N-acetyltransferase
VRHPFEGRGLVTKAAHEFTRLAFEHVGLNRVVIRAGVGNLRSRAVAERLGYLPESVERGGGRGLGGFYDIVVYALLADEWRSRAEP